MSTYFIKANTQASATVCSQCHSRICGREGGLPPECAPDFNQIKKALVTPNVLLREAEARTIEALWPTIGYVIETLLRIEYQHYAGAAGYALHA